MIGYDIDGVLADKPPLPEKKWGQMNGEERKARKEFLLHWYATAEPLLIPTQPFIAISARKDEPEVQSVTHYWFQQHYPKLCLGVALLNKSRTIENTAHFKSAIINHYELTDFTEDNKQILKRLTTPDTKLWYWDKTLTEPIPYTN